MKLPFKPQVLTLLCSAGLLAASGLLYVKSRAPETVTPAPVNTTQTVVTPASNEAPTPAAPAYATAQLDQWVAPIALYPDALLSQVLMASTYPANVLQAVQWSQDNPTLQGDAAIQAAANQPWDASVKSLVAFPQLMALMGENPQWVQNLGDAFLAQPKDVMDSVQKLRALAQQTGALKSTPEQKVSTTPVVVNQTTNVNTAAPKNNSASANSSTNAPAPQVITIEPTNPQMVYVPNYNPSTVYGTWPNTSYPPVYLPPPPGQQFTDSLVRGFGYSLGVATTYALFSSIDWHDDDDYHHHHHDDNYNSGNNINVNVNNYNRITGGHLSDNGGPVVWQHNPAFRGGVPYQNEAVAQRFHQTNVAGGLSAAQHAPANRDSQRQAAMQQLQHSTGMNPQGKSLSSISRDVQRQSGSRQLNQIAQRNNYRGYDSSNHTARRETAHNQVKHPTQQPHRDAVKNHVSHATPQQRQQHVASFRSNALSGNDSRSPSWQAQHQRGQQSRQLSSAHGQHRAAVHEHAAEHREIRRR
ncbi:DUF3300 domain-containing protein [Enterobacteriaceae bacterium H18W14]|uniref:DUF3300 domain-containing protein n=1 Tax=Dryocola boscaweniae TaxID=2925397 RepID=UPI0022F0DBDB|nr:DUF3300 domain-containing protein [Dryocola boscaweniae]MCT4715289.1 DUF3300 domain-containing protein [Dryocola boscaweniae]